MATLVLPFLFMIGAGAAVAVGGLSLQRARVAWAEAAARLGLGTASSSLWSGSSMSGRVRDIDVRVHTEQRGSGDSRSTYTVYEVNFFSDGPAVSIKRERGLGIMKRLLRTTDVVVGDPAFDDALVIDGPDAEAIGDFLTPTRRRAIYGLMQAWPMAELTASHIVVAKRRVETNADAIVSTVNRLVDTALVLAAPVGVDAALELEARGDLADGAAALADINAEPDFADNAYTRLLEAQALVALGDRDRATSVLDRIEPALPADADVMALRDMIARPRPAAADPPTPDTGPKSDGPAEPAEPPAVEPAEAAEPPAVEPAPPVDTDADAVINDLFGSDRLGHEVDERFAEVYAGQRVRWRGEVERVRPFRRDRDFGDEPGTKVTVLVGHLGDGRLVSSQIDAVVHLPADVEPARGEEIAFTGTLIRVDRFMRNLYVAHAQLA